MSLTRWIRFRWWAFAGEPVAVRHYRSALKGCGTGGCPPNYAELEARWRFDSWAAMTDEEQQYCAWRGMLTPLRPRR